MLPAPEYIVHGIAEGEVVRVVLDFHHSACAVLLHCNNFQPLRGHIGYVLWECDAARQVVSRNAIPFVAWMQYRADAGSCPRVFRVGVWLVSFDASLERCGIPMEIAFEPWKSTKAIDSLNTCSVMFANTNVVRQAGNV